MAQDTTPSGRKRRREDNDENADPSIVSSIKKRRLAQPGTPSTPKALHAIASVISGALGFSRKSSLKSIQPNKELDKSYEIPDSDEEQPNVKQRKNIPKRRASLQQAERAGNAVYDVPDSEGELGTASPSRNSQDVQATPRNSHAKSGRSGPRTSTPRKTNSQTQAVENEDDLDSPSVTPLKLGRTSKSWGTDPAANGAETTAEGAGQAAVGDVTPTTAKFSTKKKRSALDALVIDGTPKLKGILTPSRRDRGRDDDTPRKRVAFNRNAAKSKEEVYFADLPSKTIKPKKTPKKAAVAPPLEKVATNGEEEGELDDEDDEVCAICSKPDSKAPNEIVFCDNCDMAVHQRCYDIPIIPDGDWLCHNCSQEDLGDVARIGNAATSARAGEQAPDIPHFQQHLQSLQRVLLDRCTGRSPIKVRGHDEAYEKTLQLVEQTVVAGEGNSMLIIGARGCGKTTMVESVLSEVRGNHGNEFHVVRLNGFIHTDDKLALKEIWRQLGKQMDVEDDVVNKTSNYADTLASLLALLSHPSEISEAQNGVTSKSVIFVMDEFDLFATHPRQTLLYNLFDIAQARKAPIAVLGVTTRIDVVESLEKRVKSRFSHRYVYLSLPKSLPAYWDICKHGLMLDEAELEGVGAGSEATIKGYLEFHSWWKKRIETLHKASSFQSHLEFHYCNSKSVPSFLASCVLPLAAMSPTWPALKIPLETGAGALTEPPDSKLHLLESLSELDLCLLIAAARLDIVAHMDTVNFAMAYDEYSSLMSKQRVQSATSGMLAVGGGTKVWGRGVAGIAWERLVSVSLLLPAAVGARSASSHGGLEAKMWKVDVALEEIPVAVRLNAVLARWCKEI